MCEVLNEQEIGLAKWMADCMLADGVTADNFAAAPTDFIAAYGDVIAAKIVKIQSVYLTRVGAKTAFSELVLNLPDRGKWPCDLNT